MTMTDLGPFPDEPGYDEALSLDSADALADHRDGFIDDDPELLYLDGNSLGRLPKRTIDRVAELTRIEWGEGLIGSWNESWWDLQLQLGDKLAPLLGAGTGEVMVSDSTSVNLHKLALAAVNASPEGQTGIVTDDLNFPSDLYILDGVARQTGSELVIVPSDGIHGPVERVIETIDDETSVVALSHTTYASGYTYDMTPITHAAHAHGALVLWDVSHSVGAMPIDFEEAGVDLAVGCTYKYLNGGPGSPAFLYVRGEHQDRLANPITGWWGHDTPFEFELDFRPVSGIRRFHAGTMPILSLAAIEPGVDAVLEAGIEAVRAKSLALTEYLVAQTDSHLQSFGFTLNSPRQPEQRGSHVSLSHELAWPITRALIEVAKVVPDYRTPDNIRLGLAPLYTRFVDVHTAVQRIKRVVSQGMHQAYVGSSAVVT
ncbi:MAG: kynureninase [Acidimicrobiia bacterium]|jgi:kynureninase